MRRIVIVCSYVKQMCLRLYRLICSTVKMLRATGLVQFRITKSPRLNEIFMAPIERLDKHGNGLVTIEWDTMQKQLTPTEIKVRGALPGETIRFRVVSVYSTGSALHRVSVSIFGRREHLIRPQQDHQPWRSSIEPSLLPPGHEESPYLIDKTNCQLCPHFDRRHDEQSCSGCSVPHLQYTQQINEKLKLLKQSLSGAVDDNILSTLEIEPLSQMSHYSGKFEVHAFSDTVMGTPKWGQPSFQKPFSNERRKKYYVATPNCRVLPKSARAILNRMDEYIQLVHEGRPDLFSVHDEIANKGFLRSAVIQTAHAQKDSKSPPTHLLSIVVAKEPPPVLAEILKREVVERLAHDFGEQIAGIQLVEARTDLKRDKKEFFVDDKYTQLLYGTNSLGHYIPSANKAITVNLASPEFICSSEIGSKIVSELAEVMQSHKDENSPILELYSGQNELTDTLREFSSRLVTLGVSETEALSIRNSSMVSSPDSNGMQLIDSNQLQPAVDSHIISSLLTEAQSKATVVVSFPPSPEGKPNLRGVTSKEFRRWIGNTLKPKRIILMTENFEGVRKDIGHMRLLGYELKRLKAFDSRPGAMDKVIIFVALERRPVYDELKADQFV